jgi:hypothetical protein
MRRMIIACLCILMTVVFIDAVSLREALYNYQLGKGSRTIVASGVTALAMHMMPWAGGFAAYPPFIIAEVIALGIGGAGGLIYSHLPAAMKKNVWGALADAIPSPEQEMIKTYHEHYYDTPAPQFDVTSQASQGGIMQPSLEQKVSTGNIIPVLFLAAMAGSGYKMYQWYTSHNAASVE